MQRMYNVKFYQPRMEVHHWEGYTIWPLHSIYQSPSHIYASTLLELRSKHFLRYLGTPFLKIKLLLARQKLLCDSPPVSNFIAQSAMLYCAFKDT